MGEEAAPADAVRGAEDLLRRLLYRSSSEATWLAKVRWHDRDDLEFALLGGTEGPSLLRLRHAAACLASLDAVVAECERALRAVPDGHELFPPAAERRWYLDGISFEFEDPMYAQAQFTQEEPHGESQYLYVLYLVDINETRVGRAWARTW